MQALLLPIAQIHANDDNPRILKDVRFQQLVKSLQEFPEMLELRPLVVDEGYTVLGGNMRLKALQHLGYAEVPVVVASGLSDEQKKEFIIKDNGSFGEWDWDALANGDWPDAAQLNEWGVDVPPDWGVVEELPAAEEGEPDLSPPAEPITVLGDLYELNGHRLHCADSTDSDAVGKLMDGKLADLGHNDPPYGMKKEAEGVLNDNLNFDDLLEFNEQWIPLQFSILKESGSFYCWGTDVPLMDVFSYILKPYINDQKATFRNLLTWDKGSGQGQNSDKHRMFPTADEKCLFVMLGVQGFNDNADNYFEGFEPLRHYLDSEMEKVGGRSKWREALGNAMGSHYFTKSQWLMPTREAYEKLQAYARGAAFPKQYEVIKKQYEVIKKQHYGTRAYFNNTHDNMNNVWHFERELNVSEHATPKPLPLCSRVIKSSCPPNGLVVDFFLGSGSTLIAAEQNERTCYGQELTPAYCDVIVRRWLRYMQDNNRPFTVKRNGQPLTEAELADFTA